MSNRNNASFIGVVIDTDTTHNNKLDEIPEFYIKLLIEENNKVSIYRVITQKSNSSTNKHNITQVFNSNDFTYMLSNNNSRVTVIPRHFLGDSSIGSYQIEFPATSIKTIFSFSDDYIAILTEDKFIYSKPYLTASSIKIETNKIKPANKYELDLHTYSECGVNHTEYRRCRWTMKYTVNLGKGREKEYFELVVFSCVFLLLSMFCIYSKLHKEKKSQVEDFQKVKTIEISSTNNI